MQSETTRTKVAWRKLNSSLNLSYERDRTETLHRQINEPCTAEEKGDYFTTWKVVRDISGKNQKVRAKVKKRNGAPPPSDKELLSEWKDYFSSLLNSISDSAKELPPPAQQDLSILIDPPSLEETKEAIKQQKSNKAAGLDDAITAEVLQGGGDIMAEVLHSFCIEVYATLIPPDN